MSPPKPAASRIKDDMKKRWVMLPLDLAVGITAGFLFGIVALAYSLDEPFFSGIETTYEQWLIVGLPAYPAMITTFVFWGGCASLVLWSYETYKALWKAGAFPNPPSSTREFDQVAILLFIICLIIYSLFIAC